MLPVDIIGVNEIGIGPNTFIFTGIPLSWVRDTAAANVQSSWGAFFRDVVILDPRNNKLETYNLNDHPLDKDNPTPQNEANKTALKNKLIAAATPADTDNDRLPDYWEQWAYGNLSRNGATTGTDARKTLLHWAHCSTAPATGRIAGLPDISFNPSNGIFTVTYTRRRGTAFGLTLTPEFSQSLATWTTTGHGYEEWGAKPRYDGSGGETVTWQSVAPAPLPFVRIKAVLP